VQQAAWFAILVGSICLEGLGRRYLPFIPQAGFYFLKDAILLFGWVQFRPSKETRDSIRWLYRGFDKIILVAFVWTVAEAMNPEIPSPAVGLIGLRRASSRPPCATGPTKNEPFTP
jgi:hypothetical protein